jgi:hypothetical protein
VEYSHYFLHSRFSEKRFWILKRNRPENSFEEVSISPTCKICVLKSFFKKITRSFSENIFSENKIKRDHTYPSAHGVCKNKIRRKQKQNQAEGYAPAASTRVIYLRRKGWSCQLGCFFFEKFSDGFKVFLDGLNLSAKLYHLSLLKF